MGLDIYTKIGPFSTAEPCSGPLYNKWAEGDGSAVEIERGLLLSSLGPLTGGPNVTC